MLRIGGLDLVRWDMGKFGNGYSVHLDLKDMLG